MVKFINVIKYKIKDGSKDECLKKINEMPKYEGLISSKYIETGANSYCYLGEWVSEEAYKAAYPKLIEFLDTIRDFLKESLQSSVLLIQYQDLLLLKNN